MTQPDPLGPVHIGAREIYDQLLQTDKKVDQIGSRVEQVASAHAGLAVDQADHETRLRVLERSRWPLPSIAVLLSLAGLVLAILTFATRGG